MKAIYVDPRISDDERRARLYGGDLILLSATAQAEAFVRHARAMLEDAFGDLDPCEAQHHLAVEQFHAIFAPLKPAYIHHPDSWRLLADLLIAQGCDPEATYLDVPRLRVSTSDNYLTSGVAYAHHPHRDTWYAAPMQQINWWMPFYDFASESAMAFHPRYWSEGVANDSERFDYFDWNGNQRKNAAQHVKTDTRWQPHALEPLELAPEVRLVCPPGATILFSAAQLHSTVPNTSGRSRYSTDFRTIDIHDVESGRAAPNVDSSPKGTSLRDFKRLSDGQRVPEEIALRFDGRREGALIFTPA